MWASAQGQQSQEGLEGLRLVSRCWSRHGKNSHRGAQPDCETFPASVCFMGKEWVDIGFPDCPSAALWLLQPRLPFCEIVRPAFHTGPLGTTELLEVQAGLGRLVQ